MKKLFIFFYSIFSWIKHQLATPRKGVGYAVSRYKALSSWKKAALIIFFSLTLSIFLISGKKDPIKQQQKERSWQISTKIASYEDIQPYLEKFGLATAIHRVLLKVLVTGEVLTLGDFRDGDIVHANEIILTLDPTQYKISLVEEENRLIQAKQSATEAQKNLRQEQELLVLRKKKLMLQKKMLKRLESLADTSIISAKTLDEERLRFLQAKETFATAEQALERHITTSVNQGAAVKVAHASYERAERNIKNTVLVAPFDGVISEFNLAKGQSVNPQEQLGILYDPSSYEVRIMFTPTEYGRAIEGKRSLIGESVQVFQQLGDNIHEYKGVLIRVGAATSRETASIPVYVKIVSQKKQDISFFKENSFMKVLVPDILYNHVLKLPLSALYEDSVYVIDSENRLEKRQIKVVHDMGESVLAKGDIRSGERILTTHFGAAGNGVKVHFKESP